MPYREKIAWLSLLGMAVCYGPYFAFTHRSPLLEQPLPNLQLMALYVGGFMPFTSSGWHIVNAMIASVVIAELVGYALVVQGYRRGLA